MGGAAAGGKAAGGGGLLLAGAGGLIYGLSQSFYTVDGGHRAIIFSRIGGIQEEVGSVLPSIKIGIFLHNCGNRGAKSFVVPGDDLVKNCYFILCMVILVAIILIRTN